MKLVDEIKSTVVENASLFGFEYKGKEGNIDPFIKYFHLMYDGKEQDVPNFDAVLNTPFVGGHTLQELSDSGAKVIITEQ